MKSFQELTKQTLLGLTLFSVGQHSYSQTKPALIIEELGKDLDTETLNLAPKAYIDALAILQPSLSNQSDQLKANSYWTVKAFHFPASLENPAVLSPGDFKDLLRESFHAVPVNELKYGDILVLQGQFQTLVFDDRSGHPEKSLFSFSNPYHAGIVIGFNSSDEPIVLQKMNSYDSRFGLLTVEETLEYYKNANIKDLKKTNVLFYRKNNN